MIAVVEDVWNQIIQRNALKDKHFAKHRVQTALKSFTYSYLDLDSKQFLNDKKHINTIRHLRNKCIILKPDKGQGVVLIDKIDYYNSMERIFNDKTKFKVINNDPTFRNLASVQNYLNTLVSRSELTENDKMEMRPKSARLGRAHGLPKIHKDYTNIPSVCPIVDTTCTVYYSVGKYFSNLLNPLTLNEYSLKDSFEATQRIHSIPTELFAQGYQYVSFDVVSLFTNVPLKKTIEIILKRVYNDQLVQTKLKKRTLKKLLLDACQKTAFSFNGKIYKQTDSVSMGSSLGPVLANIIMTQMESEIVKPLETKGVIKHYMRYVDDTLILIKPENIETVLRKFNSFHSCF